MKRDKQEVDRLKLGISNNVRNHWHEWYAGSQKRKGSKGSAKGKKGKNNGTVEAVVEQIGLDGQLFVNRVFINDNSDLLTTVSDKRKGG